MVYYCCRRLNRSWKTLPYALLGDDIVICDKEVAVLYKKIIGQLGVEISTLKSYESPHLFEFAKRIFYKGVEISPFPMSGFNEVLNKYYLLVHYFIEAETKGWVSLCGVPASIRLFRAMVSNLPSRAVKGIEQKSILVEKVMRITKGAKDAGILLSQAFRSLGFTFILSDFVAYNVLENIAVELFADNNPAPNLEKLTKEKKLTISHLEHRLRIMGLVYYPEEKDLVTAFISALPISDVLGQIFASYRDLSKQAEGYSNSTHGV